MRIWQQQTEDSALLAIEPLNSLDQEASGERISVLAPEKNPIEKDILSTGLTEESASTTLQGADGLGVQCQAVKVVDDPMEVEGIPICSKKVRVSLGELDQNIVREQTLASQANLKIGKWKRLARSVKNDQEQSNQVLVDVLQESGQKRVIEHDCEADPPTGHKFSKRTKQQQKENYAFSETVVVASLNWPHLAQ